MRRAAGLVAAACLAALAGCGGEEPGGAAARSSAGETGQETLVELAPRVVEGETARFIHQEVSVKTQTTNLHNLLREATEVREFDIETLRVAEDGGALLRLTMRRVGSLLVDNGVPTYRYDSSRPVEGDAMSIPAPTRARQALAELVADVRMNADGTVRRMRANITPEDVRSLPESLRPLLSENWARGTLEAIYRPYGELRGLTGEDVRRAEAAGMLTGGSEGELVQRVEVLSAGGEGPAAIESETVLEIGAEAAPERYRQESEVLWSRERGRVLRMSRVERARVERELAGLDAVELLDRRFFIVEVNPDGSAVEGEATGDEILGPPGTGASGSGSEAPPNR